jgi:hypothetical protein
MTEEFAIVFFPLLIPRDTWCAEAIMKPVHRATVVTMKPGAIGTEGYMKTEGDVFITELVHAEAVYRKRKPAGYRSVWGIR